MTEPGQAPETPPNQPPVDIPEWAPTQSTPAPEKVAAAAPAGEAAPAPAAGQADPTMRLPTRAPAAATSPPPPPADPQAAAQSAVVQPAAAAPAPGGGDATIRLIPTPAPPPPVATPGQRQIGKYLVKEELGRGGMGAVYLAEQPGLAREVAIKELILSPDADQTALARFLQEAQVMARTSHPNLVQVHDLEQIGTANYIVLEFVRGKSLRDRLNLGPIPMPQIFAVMHGVLQALDYAHKHAIVHRDMKPENVLLSDEGHVKVADFGIARLIDDSGAESTATKTGTTVGTPLYMSPEQVASSKVDGRSDLYSAGIMFYELIVGQPPFTVSESDGPFTLMAKHVQAPPQPPSVHRPGLDMRLDELILKSLSKRPEERYQSGEEFDEVMSRIADRLCPGWLRSLEPGADLSKMVPATAAAQVAAVASPLAVPSMAAGGPAAGMQAQAVYNPTPPVKAVTKRATGCMGIFVCALALAPTVCLAVAASPH
ncbi:MAG: serine/threonine protein kinase [Candidatus Dormibacteraeota bacterium]|nr:serine/threonine protein kinase [Candidatus Dormibacteraeota bacterium]